MKQQPSFKHLACFILLAFSVMQLGAQDNRVALQIHLRGVWESKITLTALSGINAGKTIAETPSVKNGETATVTIAKVQLPGEFLLRFDYKQKESSAFYPSEKRIIINAQHLELWVNPLFTNNPDSSWFQQDETENSIYAIFNKENFIHKQQLAVLQNFLMGYTDTHTDFYKQAIKEYEQQVTIYNHWLAEQAVQYKSAFISSAFQFEYVPTIQWAETQEQRTLNLLENYFEGINFKDSLLVKTSVCTEWMNKYVNTYGSLCTSNALRDSLFPLAAKRAIEKARNGNPSVYGWMVDYFYNGFETNNMPLGIKALQPYLDDPDCLTNKRLQIEKRLNGIKTLVTGSQAPDFIIKNADGAGRNFSNYPTPCKYKLVLFWAAGCDHCKELIKELYPWYTHLSDKTLIEVFALGMDETKTDIELWNKVHPLLAGWNHIRPDKGINSKEANAYFVLSTPVMVLVNTTSNEIVALPQTLKALNEALK